MDDQFHFPDVTLLITHYNRSSSLERLLSAFNKLGCRFDDIVVSDDCSKPVHLEKLKSLQQTYNYQLITTPQNKGLGNNINKGQDKVKTKYTLYVQEDFEPADIFPGHMLSALQFMNDKNELDIVRFYAYFMYPSLKPFGKGYSEMVYNPWNLNHIKFYMYSDHPHLRRSNFFEKFGRYKEGIKSDITEYKMAISFIQKKGKGLFYSEFTQLFYQKNSSNEPSTIGRANWRQSRNPILLFIRWLYLRIKWLKCTWDVYYMRT